MACACRKGTKHPVPTKIHGNGQCTNCGLHVYGCTPPALVIQLQRRMAPAICVCKVHEKRGFREIVKKPGGSHLELNWGL